MTLRPAVAAMIGVIGMAPRSQPVQAQVFDRLGVQVQTQTMAPSRSCAEAATGVHLERFLDNYIEAMEDDRFADARRALRRALPEIRRVFGPVSSAVVNALRLDAEIGYHIDPLPEVLRLYDATVAAARHCYGDSHRATLLVRDERARILNNMGLLEQSLAEKRDIAARAVAAEGLQSQLAEQQLVTLASALRSAGRVEEAEPIARLLAERARQESRMTIAGARAINVYALILHDLGRYEEAEEHYARIWQFAGQRFAPNLVRAGSPLDDTAEMQLLQYVLLANRPINLVNLGRATEAVTLSNHLPRHVAYAVRPESIARPLAAGIHADVLMAAGRPREAERYYREAYDALVGRLGAGHPDTRDYGAKLAACLLRLGRIAEAARLARAVVAADDRVQGRLGFSAVSEQAAVREQNLGAQRALLLPDILWAQAAGQPGRSDLAMVFAALQRATATEVSRATARGAARRIAAGQSAPLRALVDRRLQLADEWHALERSAMEVEGSTTAPDAPRRLAAISAELDRVDRELARQFPSFHDFVRPAQLDLRSAQGLLRPGEAALIVVPGAAGTHVMLLTARTVAWHRAAIAEDELTAQVAHLRAGLDCGAACGAFDRAASHRLYRALLAPLRDRLGQVRQLFVVTEGALTGLPFSVLVTSPPAGDDASVDALRATVWLADSHALVQLPALHVLAAQRRARPSGTPAAAAGAGFLGVGDPDLRPAAGTYRGVAFDAVEPPPGGNASRFLADPHRLRALGRIGGTAAELEAIRVMLSAPQEAVLLGEAATESEIRGRDLSGLRILAFATHGVLAGEVGIGEPGLVFTPPPSPAEADDGLLVASEIAALRLTADWVILSACNTGGAARHGGSALSGLARAFLYAGARTLLVSHWRVRDEVAARLVPGVLLAQAADPALSRAQALQAAMRIVRNDPANPSAAHPSAWAPLTIVGDAF